MAFRHCLQCIQVGTRRHREWYCCAAMVALVVFTHAVAVFVVCGVLDRTGPEIVLYNMIAIPSQACQRDHLATLYDGCPSQRWLKGMPCASLRWAHLP